MYLHCLLVACCIICRFRRTSVPLVKVQPFHMVSYEGEIDSVILTHCRYSLAFGKGQEVEYDFAALEKHIYDRFLVTKPEIDRRSQPLMVYTSDIIRRDVFQQLKEKLKPQVHIVVYMQFKGWRSFSFFIYKLYCFSFLPMHVGNGVIFKSLNNCAYRSYL